MFYKKFKQFIQIQNSTELKICKERICRYSDNFIQFGNRLVQTLNNGFIILNSKYIDVENNILRYQNFHFNIDIREVDNRIRYFQLCRFKKKINVTMQCFGHNWIVEINEKKHYF